MPAYLPIEKLNIAKQYLIPDLEKEYAFQKQDQESEETADVTVEATSGDALEVTPSEKMTLTDASIMQIV